VGRSVETKQMSKPRTHFEQIPLETVKKISEEQANKKKNSGAGVDVESATKKTEPYSVAVNASCRTRG
jgi:hypothetical protein